MGNCTQGFRQSVPQSEIAHARHPYRGSLRVSFSANADFYIQIYGWMEHVLRTLAFVGCCLFIFGRWLRRSEASRDRADESQLRIAVRLRPAALFRKERWQVVRGFGQGIGNSMGVLSLL